jgi:3,4-dihydroxy 2-butanone 4-phosphate synthase/GTP cyclohydrolase II
MMNNREDRPLHQVDIISRFRVRLAEMQERYAARPFPVITLTYAQSIDGSIAPLEGGTLLLSNSRTRRMTHQLRALHDAILVGINTVLCDDPRLTVRLVSGSHPQPVVLDSRLRFPLDARLLRDPCVRPVIATGQQACPEREQQLTDRGARVIRLPRREDGLIDLTRLFLRLKQDGFESVMVEGGSCLITNVLVSQLADQLLLAIAPRFVGGLQAVKPTPASQSLPRLQDVCCQLMDGDVVLWGSLQPSAGLNGSRTAETRLSDSGPVA